MFGQLGYFHRFAGKDYEDKFYAAGELMGIADFPHVTRAGDWRNFLRLPRSSAALKSPSSPRLPEQPRICGGVTSAFFIPRRTIIPETLGGRHGKRLGKRRRRSGAAVASRPSLRPVRSRRPGHSGQRRLFLSPRPSCVRRPVGGRCASPFNASSTLTLRRSCSLRTVTQTPPCYVHRGYRGLLASGFALPWLGKTQQAVGQGWLVPRD